MKYISYSGGADSTAMAILLHERGEDFELLFTLSQEDCEELLKNWDEHVSITEIGKIVESQKMQIKKLDGQFSDLVVKGYDHFTK